MSGGSQASGSSSERGSYAEFFQRSALMCKCLSVALERRNRLQNGRSYTEFFGTSLRLSAKACLYRSGVEGVQFRRKYVKIEEIRPFYVPWIVKRCTGVWGVGAKPRQFSPRRVSADSQASGVLEVTEAVRTAFFLAPSLLFCVCALSVAHMRQMRREVGEAVAKNLRFAVSSCQFLSMAHRRLGSLKISEAMPKFSALCHFFVQASDESRSYAKIFDAWPIFRASSCRWRTGVGEVGKLAELFKGICRFAAFFVPMSSELYWRLE